MNIFRKIKHIIQGNWYNIINKNNNLAEQRLFFCDHCEHRTRITDKLHICNECGCICESKARVKDEHCLRNKW